MAKLATITQLSPTMTEGVFVEWQKKEGDAVKPGDILASIETDKAVMDLEAFDGGVLLKLLAQKGDKLPVGAPVAVIGNAGEDISAILSGITKEPKPKTVAAPAAHDLNHGLPDADHTLPNATNRIKASPLVKKLAAQGGIDLKAVRGTGPGGRIVSRDLATAGTQLAAPAPRSSIVIHAAQGVRAPDTQLPLSPMRKVIAERLTFAKQNLPHFYLQRTVNISSLIKLRSETNAGLAALHAEKKEENAELPQKVSLNDFILAATAQSLARHAEILRQWGTGHLLQLGNVDLGFAVSLDDGLITPIIRNAEQYSLFQIAEATQELSARARERRLKPEEYTGAGFTVTNLGMLGISSFQAVINAPEAAILAIGASERRATEAKDGSIKFGDFLSLNLACDHRVIDGATGAKFLGTLARFLENPGLIR
ncbi:MAG: 2-oxo acid dehydrogenase subunit E2 [Spirochaetes bacterium]|nr:2-oxo acid dehydrogenase subunit E2 [Spirochaetota bacterium]